MSHSTPNFKRLAVLAAALAPIALLTGCANMVGTDHSITASPAATIAGNVHGGQQFINGSVVTLYAAGVGSYGATATPFAQTASGADGSFSFTQLPSDPGFPTGIHNATQNIYSCPTDGSNPQMYIVAKGGNPKDAAGASNNRIALISVLGKCSTIASTFVNLNEITTVGTMAALQQYFSAASESLGYPGTTQATTAFNNAVLTAFNLVDIGLGAPKAPFPVTGTPAGATAPVTVTVTPEAAKINTVADILAACINGASSIITTSTNCSTLLSNAVPPASSAVTSQPSATFSAATDTMQAAYYMMINPDSGSAAHMQALFGLVGGVAAPFQTPAATAPTDWTIGIKYSSASACTTGNFLAAVYHPAVDAGGNIWIAGASTTGNLMEIGPTGTPLTCTLSAIGAASHSAVLDSAGNVWIEGGTGNANIYKYNPTTGTSTTWPVTGTVPVIDLVADGSGNIFYSIGTSLYEFVNAAYVATPTAAVLVGTIGSTPNFLAADTLSHIWSTASTTSGTPALYDTYPSTAAGNTNGYVTVLNSTNYTNGFGLAIGLNNTAYVANSNNGASTASNTLSFYTDAGGAINAVGATAQFAGGMSGPREDAVDGAGNVWSVNSTASGGNYVTGATTSGLYAVTEYASNGTAISPTGSGATTATQTGGFQKDLTILPAAGRGIAVDPSGNVWIGLNSAAAASTSITEIVGAAVPVVTPIPAALIAGGTSGNAVSKP